MFLVRYRNDCLRLVFEKWCKGLRFQHREFKQQQVVKSKTEEENYACRLRSAGNLKSVCEAHSQIVREGYGQSAAVGDVLVQMYGKYGEVQKARAVFDGLEKKTTFSWTAMIAAYAQNGHLKQAIEVFRAMDAKPNRYTYFNVLAACSELKALGDGRSVHAGITAAGEFQGDVCLQNAIINMYAKCGSVPEAEAVFQGMPGRDVVSWNSMISAYAQNGHSKLGVNLYRRMSSENVKPDEYTFSSVLSACSSLEEGKTVHSDIISAGNHSENTAIQNALINMYTRCSDLEEAKAVFDGMLRRNVISWTAMISAYTQHDRDREAISLFRKMDLEGVQPNNVTFATVITACSNEGMLSMGKVVHSRIRNPDFIVQNTLVNLYGKCGRVEDARAVFETMKVRTVVTWTTLIAAYAQQGHPLVALDLSRQMDLNGVLPNSVTFGCILVACSYAGLLDQGWISFTSMASDYGIQPAGEHYICMVDLLGRAGRVLEAEELINCVPVERESLGWMALLGACRTQADTERGTRAAQQAFEKHPKESGLLVLLSHVFADKNK